MKQLFTFSLIIYSFTANAQTTYYISSSGNDANNGTSTSSPWKTLQSQTAGNTYLFKRGDTFYFRIPRVYVPPSNFTKTLTFGDYGTGAKPVISTYTKVVAGWTIHSANVWKVALATASNFTGFIPSNLNVGFLKVDGIITGAKKSSLASVTSPGSFYSDETNNILYIYSTTDPSLSGIEFATKKNIFDIGDNTYVHNIKFMGGGANGISAFNTYNSTIRSCDVTEIGGSYIASGTSTTRYGNGIQLFNGADNCLIDSCNVSKCYDVSLTMQTANSTSLHIFKDITWQNNTSDSSEQGFELTLLADTTGLSQASGFQNCKIVQNSFRNSGYSWSHFLRPSIRGVDILSYQWKATPANSDVVYENNTFYKPRDGLYYAQVGTSIQPIPAFTSRNNHIFLNPSTYIRMSATGTTNGSQYTWKVDDYAAFVSSTGKEVGSIWNNLNLGTNIPPSADAGQDTLMVLPVDQAILKGAGIDPDGLALSYSWRTVAGPPSAILTSPSSPTTLVSIDQPGDYSFELKVTNGLGAVGKDTVTLFIVTGVLPLKLLNFSGQLLNGGVCLRWQTIEETNLNGFEIEKLKGNSWRPIAILKTKSPNLSGNLYSTTDSSVATGNNYYRLKVLSNIGGFTYSNIINIERSPIRTEVYQNAPNPFSSSTKIKFELQQKAHVKIIVYNSLGVETAVLLEELKEAGVYTVVWNNQNLPPGKYYYKVSAGQICTTKEMLKL